jgi:hypothetical protein
VFLNLDNMPLINRKTADRVYSTRTREEELTRARQALSDPKKLSDRQVIEAWAVIGECHMYDKKPELVEEAYLRAIKVIKTLGDVRLLGEKQPFPLAGCRSEKCRP